MTTHLLTDEEALAVARILHAVRQRRAARRAAEETTASGRELGENSGDGPTKLSDPETVPSRPDGPPGGGSQ